MVFVLFFLSFCFCFLFVVLVAMRRTGGASFRATIRLLSHDDGSIAPKATFVTDIEGNWEYFVQYVARSEALSFPSGVPVLAAEGAVAGAPTRTCAPVQPRERFARRLRMFWLRSSSSSFARSASISSMTAC